MWQHVLPPSLRPRAAVILLAAAVFALILGPFVEYQSRRARPILAALDGFLLVSIAGIVALDLLPSAVAERDVLVPILLAVGVVIPTLLERSARRDLTHGRTLVAVLALLGVGAHQLLDGTALQLLAQDGGDDRALLMAGGVAAHQLPVGVAIAWLLRARPIWWTTLLIAAMAACTVAGFVLAEHIGIPEPGITRLMALVAGLLLHVLVHDRPSAVSAEERQAMRRAEGGGGLVALVLLVVMAMSGRIAAEPTMRTILARGVDLVIDTAPALVLAYLITGALSVFAPETSGRWLARGSSLLQAFKGMAIGLPLPLCSCSVIPLYRRLAQRGGSTVGATALLIAGPELGLDAIFMSIPLLGAPIAALRMACAVIVSLVVALVIGGIVRRRLPASPPTQAPAPAARLTWAQKGRGIVQVGLVEMVDHTAPWVLVGLAAAALIGPTPAAATLAGLAVPLQVVVLALAGLPTYICASAATPLVAALGAGGVSMGAGLAFLITGPATNVTTFGILSQLHGRRVAATFSVLVLALTVLLGIGVALLWPGLTPPPPATPTLASHSVLDLAATLVFVGAVAASVLRRGVRGVLAELRPSRGEGHDHGHAHDHGHGHGHGHVHGAGCSHDHGSEGDGSRAPSATVANP